ncbi:hypothetical protein NPIL_413111 [Nephila pilipes]|uniref:Uncharacterized protein n=1 Tax=Nephila pilipes TaxID=299642 RepID=A0A8X6TK56_NEPPI|nr:hypothetical protein NPIL_413111 [Nephila pilipes]
MQHKISLIKISKRQYAEEIEKHGGKEIKPSVERRHSHRIVSLSFKAWSNEMFCRFSEVRSGRQKYVRVDAGDLKDLVDEDGQGIGRDGVIRTIGGERTLVTGSV